MKKFLLITASMAVLAFAAAPASAQRGWSGDDHGSRGGDYSDRGGSYYPRGGDYYRPPRRRDEGYGGSYGDVSRRLPDRDRDGVPDKYDQMDDRYPSRYPDRDRDGIPDYKDPYPDRPGNKAAYPYPPQWERDRYDRDSDHDGIPDRRDRTPYGERPNRHGDEAYNPGTHRPPRPDRPDKPTPGGWDKTPGSPGTQSGSSEVCGASWCQDMNKPKPNTTTTSSNRPPDWNKDNGGKRDNWQQGGDNKPAWGSEGNKGYGEGTMEKPR